jgi:IclR family transcriptional regulator, pca regulon regulatory protein
MPDTGKTRSQVAEVTAELQGERDGEEEARSPYVTAFSRGLSVIRAFSRANPALTIAEVAKATDLSRATARRFLHTLETDGYVSRDGDRYSLRPKVLELGYSYLSSMSVNDILQHRLNEAAARLGESCSIGALDGDDIVFVARATAPTPRVMTVSFSVGARIPAYLSAIGRALLAELPERELEDYLRTVEPHRETPLTIANLAELRNEIIRVREQGYCIIDQEIEMGVLAAAVPIRMAGQPPFGMSVAIHASRASASALERDYVPALQEAAEELRHILQRRN